MNFITIILVIGLSVSVQSQTWGQYLCDNVLISPCIAEGAIVGHGGGIWAKSKTFPFEEEQTAALAVLFLNPSEALNKGIQLGFLKYETLIASDKLIHGKNGTIGIIAVKTAQTVIIATYDASKEINEGGAMTVVKKFAGFLLNDGY